MIVFFVLGGMPVFVQYLNIFVIIYLYFVLYLCGIKWNDYGLFSKFLKRCLRNHQQMKLTKFLLAEIEMQVNSTQLIYQSEKNEITLAI